MYRRPSPGQLSFENFYLPFGGKLSPDNRWVKLAQLIPWETFEQEYAQQFSQTQGAPAKSFRMALGSLIIQEKLGTSDRETVAQISENPYLQYFLGMGGYQQRAPFEASMLVHFRQRLSLTLVNGINERVVEQILSVEQASPAATDAAPAPAATDAAPAPAATDAAPAPAVTDAAPAPAVTDAAPAPAVMDAAPAPAATDAAPAPAVTDAAPAPAVTDAAPAPAATDAAPAPAATDADDDAPPNSGQLLLDATCAPADIQYPTDLNLLNGAREWSERLIDALYGQIKERMSRKPRTYRRIARQRYLAIARNRKPSRRLRRKGIGQQLRYLRRNLAHIDQLVEAGAQLGQLPRRWSRLLWVIAEVYRQQQQMYKTRTCRIEHRIVSLSQPHVRPIVRGKARTPVEFGAKLSVSCINGCVFLDHLDWEAFNESTQLQQQAEAFRSRCGHYPASIHADQIYRTRGNRQWCKQRGIRLSGPPLGRPSSEAAVQAQLKQQAKADEAIRVEIEGKFGQAKRRFSLGRVMAKLAQTAQTTIAMIILVMNLERWLRWCWFFLWCFWASCHAELIPLAGGNQWRREMDARWGA